MADQLSGQQIRAILEREKAGDLDAQVQRDISALRAARRFPPPLSQLSERSKAVLEGNEPVVVKDRSLGRSLGESAVPFAAGTLGAWGGALMAGIPGAVVGAGLGSAAGEAANPYIFRALGMEEPASLTGNRLVDAGVAGIAGAGSELGAQAVLGAGRALGRSTSITPVPNAPRLLRAMDELHVTPKPTDVAGSRLPAVLERGLAQTPAGQGVVSQAMERQAGQLNTAADDWLSRLGRSATPTQTGESAKTRIVEAAKRFREVEDGLYDRLAGVANDVPVNIKGVKTLATKLVEDESLKLPGQQNRLLITQARAIFDSPDEVPFRVLREWQKGFGRVLNAENGLIARDIPIGEAKALWQATTSAMEDGIAASANPQAQRLFETARNFSAKGRELFKDSSLAQIMTKDPEDAMRMVDLQGGPSAIRRAKQAILGDPAMGFAENPSAGDRETWNLLRRHLFEGIFGPASTGGAKAEVRGMTTPVLLGSKLEKQLTKLGDESLNELLNPTERAALDKLVTVAKAIRSSERVAAQGFTSSTPQGLAVQSILSAPGAAIGGAVAGPYGMAAGGLLGYMLTAPVLAKLVTSESAARIIASPAFDAVVTGVQTTGRVSGEGMRVLARLGATLAAESHRPSSIEAARGAPVSLR